MTVLVVMCAFIVRWAPLRVVGASVGLGAIIGSLDLVIAAFAVGAMGRLIGRLRERRWRQRRRHGLPEFLEGAARALDAGMPLDQALSRASPAAPGLAPKVDLVAGRLQRGLGAVEALDVLRRIDDAEVRFAAASIELAHAQLTDAQRTLADGARALRERRLRRSDVATQSAQATSSAITMALLPWAGVVLSYGFDRDSLSGFVEPGPQRSAVLVGVCLSAMGALWSLRFIDGVERLR